MNTLTLRPAETLQDALIVHQLTQIAYAEYLATSAPSSATLETAPEVREAMATGRFAALIAESDGRAVGAVRFRVDAQGLYFFRLAVHPDFRRRGVAQEFLNHLTAEASRRRANRLWCQVRMMVPQNVALYRKNEFALIGNHVVVRGGVEIPTATMEKRLPS